MKKPMQKISPEIILARCYRFIREIARRDEKTNEKESTRRLESEESISRGDSDVHTNTREARSSD